MNHSRTYPRRGFPHMARGYWIVALTIASWLPFVLAVEAVKAALRGML